MRNLTQLIYRNDIEDENGLNLKIKQRISTSCFCFVEPTDTHALPNFQINRFIPKDFTDRNGNNRWKPITAESQVNILLTCFKLDP